MSTKDELEARAKEWLEANTLMRWATEPKYGSSMEEMNRRPNMIVKHMISFAQQEARRAGEAKVREFIRRLEEVDPWVGSDVNIPKVYREMFPDSDL